MVYVSLLIGLLSIVVAFSVCLSLEALLDVPAIICEHGKDNRCWEKFPYFPTIAMCSGEGIRRRRGNWEMRVGGLFSLVGLLTDLVLVQFSSAIFLSQFFFNFSLVLLV